MIDAPQVPRYHCRIPRLVVRPGQGQATELGIHTHRLRSLALDLGCNFHIPQLPDVEVAAVCASRPAEEDIARALHQALSDHDALTVMWYGRAPGIAFEHRAA